MRARFDEVALAGGARGESDPPAAALDAIETALPHVPTEASAMALRCARGETGSAEIRGGRRTVELSALGGRLLWFDAHAGARRAPRRLAAAVEHAGSLQEAHELLTARGVRTELAYELDAAGPGD